MQHPHPAFMQRAILLRLLGGTLKLSEMFENVQRKKRKYMYICVISEVDFFFFKEKQNLFILKMCFIVPEHFKTQDCFSFHIVL